MMQVCPASLVQQLSNTLWESTTPATINSQAASSARLLSLEAMEAIIRTPGFALYVGDDQTALGLLVTSGSLASLPSEFMRPKDVAAASWLAAESTKGSTTVPSVVLQMARLLIVFHPHIMKVSLITTLLTRSVFNIIILDQIQKSKACFAFDLLSG
jgi:hypothetical protein